jgi:hypothetical protein
MTSRLASPRWKPFVVAGIVILYCDVIQMRSSWGDQNSRRLERIEKYPRFRRHLSQRNPTVDEDMAYTAAKEEHARCLANSSICSRSWAIASAKVGID